MLAKPEPTAPRRPVNPLLSDKLLDAKVRLHRRLIEEINLSALEKLPEDEMRRQIQRWSRNTSLAERLALNAQELDDFVDEILDEMTGPRPDRAAAQGPDRQRHPDQRPRMRLRRARAACSSRRRCRFKDEAHLLRIVNKIVSAVGRRVDESHPLCDARLLDGSRVNVAVRPIARRRPAGVDPQILQEAVQPEQAGRDRRDRARRWPKLLAAAVQCAHHHDHLGRHRLGQDHDAQRAVGVHLRQGAPDHHRGRGRAAAAAAARRPHGDAAAEHRRQGRNPPARAGQERAAHAARPHHPRRVPRRGSLRHAAGHEHRPRRLDGDHPRQQRRARRSRASSR